VRQGVGWLAWGLRKPTELVLCNDSALMSCTTRRQVLQGVGLLAGCLRKPTELVLCNHSMLCELR
jgi:hypothetical protein